jgi:chaperonin cofactor prefoldin
MSPKAEAEISEPKKGKDWPVPSWKKIGEYVVGIFKLERSVEALKEQNKKLEAQVETLQRQADEHSGQMKIILSLIDSTINERAAQTAEQAALRVVEQLLSFRGNQPPKVR